MKKLGKLTISSEKMMKNEELINLQGGYDVACKCEGFDTSTGTWFDFRYPGTCAGMSDCTECSLALTNLYGYPVSCEPV